MLRSPQSISRQSAQYQTLARPITRLLVEPDRRPGWFVARLDSSAEILGTSHQPLVDGARALLARGFAPATLLTLRHAGAASDSFRPAPISEWAKWTYAEGDRRGLQCKRWMPFPANRSGQERASAGVAVPSQPAVAEIAVRRGRAP